MITCSVLLNTNACEAPPASAEWDDRPPSVRTRCYQCGQPACRECSTVINRRRRCNDCQEENQRIRHLGMVPDEERSRS